MLRALSSRSTGRETERKHFSSRYPLQVYPARTICRYRDTTPAEKSERTGESRDENKRAPERWKRRCPSQRWKKSGTAKELHRVTSSQRTKLIGGATSNPRDNRGYDVKVERTSSSSTSKKLQLRESDYTRWLHVSRCMRLRRRPSQRME